MSIFTKHHLKDLTIIIIFIMALISLKYHENTKVEAFSLDNEEYKIQLEKEHFWGLNI